MPLKAQTFMTDRHELLTYKHLEVVPVGNPFSKTITGVDVWQIVSCKFDLQTAGGGLNRQAFCYIEEEHDYQAHYSYASVEQASGVTWTYNFTVGVAPVDLTTLKSVLLDPLGCCYQVKVGDNFEIDWVNRGAADQISEIYIRYFLWKES